MWPGPAHPGLAWPYRPNCWDSCWKSFHGCITSASTGMAALKRQVLTPHCRLLQGGMGMISRVGRGDSQGAGHRVSSGCCEVVSPRITFKFKGSPPASSAAPHENVLEMTYEDRSTHKCSRMFVFGTNGSQSKGATHTEEGPPAGRSHGCVMRFYWY